MSRINRVKIYLKVRKVCGKDELWISPAGTKKEYYLTDKKITLEEIKNWGKQKELI